MAFGPRRKRKWLMVDCGLAFADPEKAGIEIILPDLAFVEKIKRDLVGLVITHAHEDHIGAVADLWPRFRCPLFATPFAAALLAARLEGLANAPEINISTVKQSGRLKLDPFDVEFISMAHSIPESCALAIRTPHGTVLHTGDWKIDPEPGLGLPTDLGRLTEIGDEGARARCDSTNILREGVSPSEAEVALALRDVIGGARGRVVVTTFASNVARIRAVALAAKAAGRKVVLLGRAMERVVNVARESGFLEGVDPFLSGESYSSLGRDEMVLLATGSQGESRAAMARIALDDHPIAKLSPGDTVIFSSRTIPGNEREVGRIINNLVKQGIEVITDRDGLVHASGHPRRGEVAQLYGWLRPKIVVPAHGEELHLAEHALFAAERGIETVVKARNGDVVLLAPGDPAIIDEVPHGQLARDGSILLPLESEPVISGGALFAVISAC